MAKNDELLDILQLINTDGVGPITFYNCIKKAGNIKNALNLMAQKRALYPREMAGIELEKATKIGAEIISYQDKRYPQNLLELNDAPPVLYASGRIDLLNYPVSVSIVGARNASIGGRKMASRIAYDLTEADVLVVSGMARGIDAAAHKGALYAKEQKGATIAVLGTGIDIPYPTENTELYHNICENGLLISEFPLGTAAQVSNFPRRNRIIAALTEATLVVEASVNSGSLITAKLALEQGKEIFAVPGSPMEPRSAGPNRLIKEGALLTENSDDILNVLSMRQNRAIKEQKTLQLPLDKPKNQVNISAHKETAISTSETPAENVRLIDLISYEGVDIDELLRTCGLPQSEFFAQILDLEFSGKIERHAGNKVAKIKG
ncbi:MAG: DNA-processing protein DprA [Alphaproteobacteria bacterium]|nr:DNA-processing protein DprA [Alphaproteobacteria bacterium]